MMYLLAAVAALFGLMVVMQVVIRLKARALRGKPLPELSGAWTKKLAGQSSRILYFFSPGCAACRPVTPRFQEMSKRRPKSVFVVNVAEELSLARALNVMATPSLIEVANGIVVGYHVGAPPTDVMARYA